MFGVALAMATECGKVANIGKSLPASPKTKTSSSCRCRYSTSAFIPATLVQLPALYSRLPKAELVMIKSLIGAHLRSSSANNSGVACGMTTLLIFLAATNSNRSGTVWRERRISINLAGLYRLSR